LLSQSINEFVKTYFRFKMVQVMIADDSEAVRLTLKDIISVGNHELVAEAADGVETIEKFTASKPDVLLLDVAMPKKDGLTALKEIKKTHTNAKIIMITAHEDMTMVQDCVAAGALAYIMKPFDVDKVLKSISYAVQEN